jgi:hypothetical protein
VRALQLLALQLLALQLLVMMLLRMLSQLVSQRTWRVLTEALKTAALELAAAMQTLGTSVPVPVLLLLRMMMMMMMMMVQTSWPQRPPGIGGVHESRTGRGAALKSRTNGNVARDAEPLRNAERVEQGGQPRKVDGERRAAA